MAVNPGVGPWVGHVFGDGTGSGGRPGHRRLERRQLVGRAALPLLGEDERRYSCKVGEVQKPKGASRSYGTWTGP